jgi:hypothetical protein
MLVLAPALTRYSASSQQQISRQCRPVPVDAWHLSQSQFILHRKLPALAKCRTQSLSVTFRDFSVVSMPLTSPSGW